ncbi:unnamed protein product [Camellia sinensis]
MFYLQMPAISFYKPQSCTTDIINNAGSAQDKTLIQEKEEFIVRVEYDKGPNSSVN